jgi:hypothetical protein
MGFVITRFWKLSVVFMAVIAIALLAVVPGFVSADAPRMQENCDMQQSRNSTSIPLCCLIADSPLSNCGFYGTAAGMITPVFKPVSTPDSNSLRYQVIELSQNTKRRFQRFQINSIQKIPPLSSAGIFCRNSLSSEDPSLI